MSHVPAPAAEREDPHQMGRGEHMPIQIGGGNGHNMLDDDPENPQRWSHLRKIYVSMVAFGFAFTVAFGLTAYTTGIATGVVVKTFNVSMTASIVPFSLYFLGIAFAPIWTPHASEKFGRTPVYLTTIPIWGAFTLGAGYANCYVALAACRFFAGFFGGPSLVLIEGTFADVWSSDVTVTYYACLTFASYLGAACGPLVSGFVLPATSFRWHAFVPLMVGLVAYAFAIGMPETYPREILRKRARRAGKPHNLPLAQSGATLGEMAKITIITPLIQLVSEPIVMLSTLYVSFVFATVFQWFITVPAVLTMVYKFTIEQDGLAFISAIIGGVLAVVTSFIMDRIGFQIAVRRSANKSMVDIEYRLMPAMLGGLLVFASLFWIGNTASPKFNWAVPVTGTMVFVWGNMMGLISIITYLFDAYPRAGTLSALTIAASMRLIFAAWLPLVIVQFLTRVGGPWTYGTFGFIGVALATIPWFLFFAGASLRMKSRYNRSRMEHGESAHMTKVISDSSGTAVDGNRHV